MSRSSWKGPFIDSFLLKKDLTKIKKIWSRRSIITSTIIGKNILIYNGKVFKKIFITREKVGYKFGEFCSTRIYNSKFQKKNNYKK